MINTNGTLYCCNVEACFAPRLVSNVHLTVFTPRATKTIARGEIARGNSFSDNKLDKSDK